jgi:transposase
MLRQLSIPLEEATRDYFVVEELPYGLQAQADFGQYILRNAEEKRKKVHFFVMMLSRSRMKFVLFSATPFTSRTAIDAHEEAFKFFQGIPREVVYDQDRLFLVDENMGDLLLTQDFKTHVFEQEFSVYFCRKADPGRAKERSKTW